MNADVLSHHRATRKGVGCAIGAARRRRQAPARRRGSEDEWTDGPSASARTGSPGTPTTRGRLAPAAVAAPARRRCPVSAAVGQVPAGTRPWRRECWLTWRRRPPSRASGRTRSSPPARRRTFRWRRVSTTGSACSRGRGGGARRGRRRHGGRGAARPAAGGCGGGPYARDRRAVPGDARRLGPASPGHGRPLRHALPPAGLALTTPRSFRATPPAAPL
jgi:hypothetical protein